jgi:Flp pilus assembly CpaE family ATPase
VALEPVPSIPSLVVVAHDDPATADSLRHAVESAGGWQALVADPSVAGLTATLAAGPSVALIGCAALANLPADFRVPLVAVGDDDRPADVRAAMAAGARSLLAWPDGAADLPTELARVAATATPGPTDDHSALIIATRGVQGGAGTTTLAAHIAGAWARHGPSSVLLGDLAGGLAFRLDLGPGVHTWSSIAEHAAGPEALLAADLLSTPADGLAVLPLRGLVDGGREPPPEPWMVQTLLAAARSLGHLAVVDLPPLLTPAGEAALAAADVLLAVSRPESAGVRGLQAALDAWEEAGHDAEAGGAVVACVRARAPLSAREVRAALGDRLWALLPDSGAELAAAAEDGVLLTDRPEVPAVQAMLTLAHQVVPFPSGPADSGAVRR